MRIERDSMGEVSVPDGAYYGASTQRAVENFPISGIRFPRRFIWALGLVKGSAARIAGPAGHLPAAKAEAIAAAADEVRDGRARRPVPAGHLPDRVGNVDQHQRQRGDRRAGQRTARRCVERSIPTTRSTSASRPTTSSRPPSTSPPSPPSPRTSSPHWGASATPWPPRPRSSPGWSSRGGRTSWTPPRSPSARSSADTPPRSARGRPGSPRCCPSSRSWRSAGPRWDRPQRSRRFRRRGHRRHGRHHRLPAARGRRPLRGAGRQGRRGQGLRGAEDGGRSRCSRSPTTCAGWAAAPAPGSPRSGCRRCNPARRSCRARSTR